jgi:A/G-specific adenine glycosylase
MVMVQRDDGAVLLLRRPPQGIWGGLWSLPEFSERMQAQAWCTQELGYSGGYTQLPALRHAFTHFELSIIPLHVRLFANRQSPRSTTDWIWYKPGQPKAGGMAAPVARLLTQLAQPVAAQHSLDLKAS